MAMTKCSECKTDISTTAEACPKCGAKQVRTSGCAKVVLAVLGFFVFVSIVGTCTRDGSQTATETHAPPVATVVTATQSTPTPAPPPVPVKGSQWAYAHDSDPMGKGTMHSATVVSSNMLTFSAPYDDAQHGMLMLRTHPRHGKDLILAMQEGQFLCRSYEDCSILVRFDDGGAQAYSAVGPSDGGTTHIFIRNYSRFVSSMLRARRVRIAAEVYQEGSPVFEFDVSDFDEAKYKNSQN